MRFLASLTLPFLLLAAGSAEAVRITPAHSGSWYDPDYNVQGFTIEVLGKAGNGPERIVAVQWNTYDDDGLPTWAVGVGTTERNVVSMTMLRGVGGARPPVQQEPEALEPWAEMTFTFGTCHTAVADFTMIDTGEEGSYQLRRLTQIGATTCTGGLGDEVEPGFEATTIVKRLQPSASHPEAMGIVKLFLRPAFASFQIDIKRVPVGTYSVRVGGVNEGDFEVVRVGGGPGGQGGMNMGTLRFASPNAEGQPALSFDPRGQLVEIVNAGGIVAASVQLPDDGEENDPEED